MKLLLLGLLFTFNAYATKRIVIYTDQPDQSKANGLAEYMRTTSPFDEYDIEYDVVNMSTSDLDCGRRIPHIPRNVSCNSSRIARQARRGGYDQALVVSHDATYGGSGGSVPVMTSSDQSPYSMMVHEYLDCGGLTGILQLKA